MMRLVVVGLLTVSAMMTAATAISPAQAKTYQLRWSDIGPPRGPRAKAMMWWAEELAKRSNGQIKIKFFWGQSLIKTKDNLRALGSGLVETAQINATYHPAELPFWNYASKAFGVNDEWVGMRSWYEVATTTPEMLQEAKRNKFKLLFINTTGPVQLLSAKVPITTVAELQGKKIRATGAFTGLLKALGAVPVSIGFGELYSALDRGTIDATINYTPFVKSYKHNEVASHLTEANMGQYLAYGGGIALSVWNDMPKQLQDIIDKTSIEYMDLYARYQIDETRRSRKELMAGIDGKKVIFHSLSEAERAKWIKAADGFTTDWVAKIEKAGMDAQGFLKKLDAATAKWEAVLKAKGYPWKR